MNTSQQSKSSLISLLLEMLQISARLFWKSNMNIVRPVLQRQEALTVLGLPPNATPQQIKRRYRVLAKQYHPDLGGDLQQMQKLSAAYEVLMREPVHS